VRLKDVVAAEALAAKTLAAATAVAKADVTAAAGVTALVASGIRVVEAKAAFLIAQNAEPPKANQTAADSIPKSTNQTAADLASATAAQAGYEEVGAVSSSSNTGFEDCDCSSSNSKCSSDKGKRQNMRKCGGWESNLHFRSDIKHLITILFPIYIKR